jgi:putative restriction endonuclease
VPDLAADAALRAAVFAWLGREELSMGPVLAYQRLCTTEFGGERLALIDPGGRGIRNPAKLAATLSVLTSRDGPYDDDVDDGSGLVRYRFRTGNADQGDNIKLVRAHELGVPIIYFQKIAANSYTAIYPVHVAAVDEDSVLLDLSESSEATTDHGTPPIPQRRYAAAQTKRRLHQVVFRGQVLLAYATSCAVCRLHEPTLLEASHILGDADGGEPAVTNGISLCTLHHRAYDRNLLGISADTTVHITPRLLAATDGPMLLHGLQEMHGTTLTLPHKASNHPDRDHLGQRFQQFRDAR